MHAGAWCFPTWSTPYHARRRSPPGGWHHRRLRRRRRPCPAPRAPSAWCEIREFWDGMLVLGGAISDGYAVRAAEVLGPTWPTWAPASSPPANPFAQDAYKQMLVRRGRVGHRVPDAVSGTNANFPVAQPREGGLPSRGAGAGRRQGKLKPLTDEAKAWRDMWSAGHGVATIHDVPSARESGGPAGGGQAPAQPGAILHRQPGRLVCPRAGAPVDAKRRGESRYNSGLSKLRPTRPSEFAFFSVFPPSPAGSSCPSALGWPTFHTCYAPERSDLPSDLTRRAGPEQVADLGLPPAPFSLPFGLAPDSGGDRPRPLSAPGGWRRLLPDHRAGAVLFCHRRWPADPGERSRPDWPGGCRHA